MEKEFFFQRNYKKNKIIDNINLNNYGIVFHSTKTIEKFQKLSGMEGDYTKEYQIHYINLVGRINTSTQQLDIAIPLVMYNYEQYVAGASIQFHLDNVTNANEKAIKLAEDIYQKFAQTDMFKTLSESMNIQNWIIQGFNSIHAHPNGINNFSGVDLNKDIDHPGVCFPLSSGENISNFASIVQHKTNFAELIHTEYRVFNGNNNSDRIYEKGRCITIVKGYQPKPPTPPKPIEPGDIDKLFGVIPEQKVIKYIHKDRKSYNLLDMIKSNKIFENTIQEFSKLWESCDFEIDTSLILKSNVKYYKQPEISKSYIKQYGSKKIQTLFEDDILYSKPKNKKNKKNLESDKYLKELIEFGFDIEDFIDFTDEELKEQYDLMIEMSNEILDDYTEEEMIDQLVKDRIYTFGSLVGKSKQELFNLYSEVYQV